MSPISASRPSDSTKSWCASGVRRSSSACQRRTFSSESPVLRSSAKPEDAVAPEEEIKDPYVLELLDLKDEYSETQVEQVLIRHLETFLSELGVAAADPLPSQRAAGGSRDTEAAALAS